jgi:uncharacterized membrane protein YdjX (TVP38/TMEM64 family)
MPFISSLLLGGFMEEQVLFYFEKYATFAIVISLLINILISVAGIIPSFFLTAANILFFGFWYGTIISFLGESLGAIVSFLIYRKGFGKLSKKIPTNKYPKVKRLLEVEHKEAFYLILALRLFPFVPSGIVNVFAALGKVSLLLFTIASSIGKIPALLIEAYSVLQITKFTWQGKAILTGISIYFFIILFARLKRNRRQKGDNN